MFTRNIQQAQEALRGGHPEVAARLLNFTLNNERLTPKQRAATYTLLARTSNDIDFQIECYNRALEYDPNNQDIIQRRMRLLTPPPPPTAPPYNSFEMPLFNGGGTQGTGATRGISEELLPGAYSTETFPSLNQNDYSTGNIYTLDKMDTHPQHTVHLSRVQPCVGVLGGPHGKGTGFFITHEGLVVTTHHVTGSENFFTIELQNGQQYPGQIRRAYPDTDLSFIQTNIQVEYLLQPINNPIPNDTRLVALSHPNTRHETTKRTTNHKMGYEWFPTGLTKDQITDAGGQPLFDARNVLCGMLTKNVSHTNGLLYGIHITHILRFATHYVEQKRRSLGTEIYCNACGNPSRAADFGGYYCEFCGHVLPPYAKGQKRDGRTQQKLAYLYRETSHSPCPQCGSQVGYFQDRCLRCGKKMN